MKRRVMFTIIAALLLALMVSLSASAQPASYTSGFQLQNQDSTNAANVTISYYNKDGSLNVSPVSDTVPAGGSNTYFPLTDPSAGFDGSVVISSDQPVAAIVNILGDNGAFGGASYDSFSQGATSSNIPLILRNYFGISTFFNVQNTGDAPATVTVTYTPTSGASCSESPVTVQPGAAATFDQLSSTASCMTDGFIGAASVTTAGQPVAVAVIQFDSQSLLAYNAFTTSGSTDAVAPLVSMNFFGSRTALQIQNTSGSSASVTVDYVPSSGFPGSACSETQTVAAGASGNFGDSNFFNNTPACNAGSGWVGSAQVSSDQNVVAIVNSVTTGTANAAAYSAFDPNVASTTVNFPLIMQDNFSLFTGFAVANVGAATTTITCTYSGSTATSSASVPAGESLTEVHDTSTGIDLGDGYVGASTCTASEPIVGVVSQLNPGTEIPTGDGLLYYEGFGN